MIKKSVLTIVVGKPYYLALAENLLQSFLLWNINNDVVFLLITDNAEFYKKYTENPKVVIKQITIDDADRSFTSKFKLFEHAIGNENLFIDCDCLVYQDIDYLFGLFSNNDFSAIGNEITSGNFFCDVQQTIARFKLNALPKFVGSVYYFKNNEKAGKIFKTAIDLKSRYDELGFVRLNNRENEEPLFAVAMGLENEHLLSNNGNIKADVMYYRKIISNILKGDAYARNPNHAITGGEIIPDVAYPAILHFNGSFSESYQYKSEIYKLKNYNAAFVDVIAYLSFKLPFTIKNSMKNLLRPAYRFVWVHRKIKQGSRS